MGYIVISYWTGGPCETERVDTLPEAYQARDRSLTREAWRVEITMLIEVTEK